MSWRPQARSSQWLLIPKRRTLVLLRETENLPKEAQRKMDNFFAHLSRAHSRALLLDYDGTLAPFQVDRDLAEPYPEIPALIHRIRRSTNTRVGIATGRRAKEISGLIGIHEIETWGCHGMERLHANGIYELAQIDAQVQQRISEINERLANEGLSELLEFKPTGTAVHWRGRRSAPDVASKVRRVWLMTGQEGLKLIRFDGGLEIRAAGKNKGDIVRTVLGEMGEKAAIAYFGDDQTDEDAFAALQGFGLGVLVQPEYRPTVADAWVRPPEGVMALLQNWIRVCGGE